MKKNRAILGFALFIGLLGLASLLTWQHNASFADPHDPVEVYAIATKDDADCIFIRQGAANILVDTGEEVDGEAIVAFLQEQDVTEIQYLILTHEDQDHIGSAPRIAENFPIRTVIEPYLPEPNEKMQALNELFSEKKTQVIIPTHTRDFNVGTMHFAIYPPLKKHYAKDNDYSLAMLLNHGKVNMVFLGDAQNKRAKELLKVHWPQEVSLLKVPYHGRYQANTIPLLEKISPENAVITSSQADQEIVDVLTQTGSKLYYSGNGTVAFQSDAVKLTEIP